MNQTNPGTMSPRVMPGLLAAAARCGFSLPDVLRSAGIRVQADASHDGLPPNASIDTILRLHDAARAASSTACFPLALADSFRFEFFPEAETFLQSSRNLREAMAMLPLIPSVVHPDIVFDACEAGDRLSVRLKLDAHIHGPSRDDLALTAFAVIHRLLVHLLPVAPDGIVLHLRQPAGRWQDSIRAYFRFPVHFDQAEDCLLAPRRLLDMALLGDFPELHANARLQLEAHLARQQQGSSLATQLRQHWHRHPESLGADLAATATALELHPRTLQRRLRSEGLSFGGLLRDYRLAQAQHYLQQPALDIESISLKLGFQDRHAFSHAFKQWTGLAPMTWRQQLTESCATRPCESRP